MSLTSTNPNAKQIMSRIALKIDTWENWQKTAAQDLVLHAGEVAFVQVGTIPPMPKDASSNGNKTNNVHLNVSPNSVLFKVGDGVSKFKDLTWVSAPAADVYDWAKVTEEAFYKKLTGKSEVTRTETFVTTTDFNSAITDITDVTKDGSLAKSIKDLTDATTGAGADSLASRITVVEGLAGIGGDGDTGSLATVTYVNDQDDAVKRELKGTSTRTDVATTIAKASDEAVAAQSTADAAEASAKTANDWINTHKTNLEKVSADPVTKSEAETAAGNLDDALETKLVGTSTVEGVVATIKGASAQAIAAQSTATEALSKANTLIGSDSNKSVRTIANEELAAQLIPAGAKEALNTLQEIAAWIQDHPDDAAEFNRLLAGLGTTGEGDNAKAKTVKEYVDGLVTTESTNRANAISAAIEALDVDEVIVGANKTLVSIKETNGKISTQAVDIAITKSQVTDFAHNHDEDYASKSEYNEHVTKAITTDHYLLIDCGSSTINVD